MPGDDLETLDLSMENFKKTYNTSAITSMTTQDQEPGYIEPDLIVKLLKSQKSEKVLEVIISFTNQTNHDNELFEEDNMTIAKTISDSFPNLRSIYWCSNDGPGQSAAEYLIKECPNLKIVSFWGAKKTHPLHQRLKDSFLDIAHEHGKNITRLLVPDQAFSESKIKSAISHFKKRNPDFVMTYGPFIEGILEHPRLSQ